jgi:N-acetylglucosaminyldiphosphoundecaprenol N-acetyl-beta-D-mannosaminyltransferase
MNHRYLLDMRVDATTYEEATGWIADWAREGLGRYVCCACVHMVMEGFDHPEFRRLVNEASLVTADGMPLVWALRGLAVRGAQRVYGPDLTRAVLARAEQERIPVGFYGGAPNTLLRLVEAVRRSHPLLPIAYACSPPFRPLDDAEGRSVIDDIRASGTRILFVGLGCPKQERWMAGHRGRIPAVMLGVGAAFDQLAGVMPRAPRLMQRSGLEWLFRLALEPGRLFHRYLSTNPRFVLRFGAQYLRALGGHSGAAR